MGGWVLLWCVLRGALFYVMMAQVLLYGGDHDVRYAFVLEGEAWGGEIRGIEGLI